MLCRALQPAKAISFANQQAVLYPTVKGKIALQAIWKMHVEQDEFLPEDFQKLWSPWYEEVELLHQIAVPRFYGDDLSGRIVRVTVHVFSDASPQLIKRLLFLVSRTPQDNSLWSFC